MISSPSREAGQSHRLGIENFRDKFIKLYMNRSITLEDTVHVIETEYKAQVRQFLFDCSRHSSSGSQLTID